MAVATNFSRPLLRSSGSLAYVLGDFLLSQNQANRLRMSLEKLLQLPISKTGEIIIDFRTVAQAKKHGLRACRGVFRRARALFVAGQTDCVSESQLLFRPVNGEMY